MWDLSMQTQIYKMLLWGDSILYRWDQGSKPNESSYILSLKTMWTENVVPCSASHLGNANICTAHRGKWKRLPTTQPEGLCCSEKWVDQYLSTAVPYLRHTSWEVLQWSKNFPMISLNREDVGLYLCWHIG